MKTFPLCVSPHRFKHTIYFKCLLIFRKGNLPLTAGDPPTIKGSACRARMHADARPRIAKWLFLFWFSLWFRATRKCSHSSVDSGGDLFRANYVDSRLHFCSICVRTVREMSAVAWEHACDELWCGSIYGVRVWWPVVWEKKWREVPLLVCLWLKEQHRTTEPPQEPGL